VPEHGVAPVSWSVNELVLLHSHIGQNLPYTVLGRWPLLM
jgi:2'-5' RNA ligase